ncbi:cytochrome b/b6 domain-containing protein [Campylobacter geochelonis]|uniref:Formate dehydrogenase-N subunit gamma n=1 Tax=Campylobacter geochelonis TaxID=1780362 RepID=A0A128EQ86_9BACT|nr:cytochrome b/b6 domain-containing protein [Campylobacter geochelonis]QKF71396.1 molybdopterin-dependent oxidoreductase, cytochrome b subunit [Campylobacter geochelonis]CZE47730.1 Formate dehydrogenase-N subunit gamma [Campylobacter geochelonis]CZE48427.1 Formate dehydrogenase-N subunit gamma [Campylobacter geochelonis]CZE50903.1 Formate dehydrogenase-N subunit gamma [Campylobacter geochelonis]
MKKIRAYHPLERAYHKYMILFVFLLILSGLPFFSKSFDFIAYVVGYPVSEFLGNGEALASGLMVLRVIHWSSGFLLGIISVLFLLGMICKINKLNIFPDRWGVAAIFDGIKQMQIHYLEHKPAKFGKLNIGQKASAWVMFLTMATLIISGVLLALRNINPMFFDANTTLLLRDIHSVSFVILVIVLIIHMFFALLPSNESSYKAMFETGEMDEEYVKSHHPLWYEKLQKDI